uniref:Uncharacterized protein n=1 Tax=Romanomermis culicivorax TaxID=13658 RepID=A0A915HVH1_ROMCU
MNYWFLSLFFCEKNCPLFKGGKVCSSNTQCCERQRCDQETGFCRWIEIGEKLNSDKVCAKDFNCPNKSISVVLIVTLTTLSIISMSPCPSLPLLEPIIQIAGKKSPQQHDSQNPKAK